MAHWGMVADRIIDLLVTEWEYASLFVSGNTLPDGRNKRHAQFSRRYNISRADWLILGENIQHALIIEPGRWTQSIQGAQRRFSRGYTLKLHNYVLFRGNFQETMDELEDSVEYVVNFLNQFPLFTLDRRIFNTFAPNEEGMSSIVDNNALSSLQNDGMLATLDTHAQDNSDYSLPALPSRNIDLDIIGNEITEAGDPMLWQGESQEWYVRMLTLVYRHNYNAKVIQHA